MRQRVLAIYEGDRIMNTIKLSLEPTIGYIEAYRTALHEAAESEGSVMLLSWYDRSREKQGPTEVCGGENWRCALDYAEQHDADLRVSVNTDQYEFFFSKVIGDIVELSEDELLAVHGGISADEFSNIQGG
jgi:hypothetical protein